MAASGSDVDGLGFDTYCRGLKIRGPKPTDRINRRISCSGSKAQYRGDARNHGS